MNLIDFGFLALWAFWVIYWVASAWGNKRTVQRANPAWRIMALLFLVAIAVVFHRYASYFARRILAPSAGRAEIGLALTAIGLGFAVWARRVLGTNWSGNPTIKENHELVQRGPYRIVRHPIYTGLLLAIAGGCLADGRMRDVFVVFVVVALVIVKLRIEENLMVREFPDAYPAYRKRTKALVPFVF